MLVINYIFNYAANFCLEYRNVNGGVNFGEIIKIGADTAEKYLTNLSFC